MSRLQLEETKQKGVNVEKEVQEVEFCFVWFLNVLDYIADGPQERESDNFTCCVT